MSACPCTAIVVHRECPEHGHLAAAVEADRLLIVAEQPAGRCELCGTVAETRPYGPNEEEVCFDCGMKDEPAARRGFLKRYGIEKVL